MISFDRVSKRFSGTRDAAVDDLTFEIERGETVVLVGPSGCGKTTTMKMINRLIEPSAGRIIVNGTDVLEQDPVRLRRNIGYVIQSIGLMPHRTIAENIATVPKLIGWDEPKINRRVHELVEVFELDTNMLSRYPSELSGGQRQRVGVARALAADPPVMLMDEPFGAVDPIVRERLQDQFRDIQARLRKTIVFVTHDIDEAIKMADRIVILNLGAAIEQYDSPAEILRNPASDFVSRFVGAERGLKRLALVKVSDIDVEDGPVVRLSDTRETALRVMEDSATPWATVIDADGRLEGWVDAAMLANAPNVGSVSARKYSAYVTAESSLRNALDAIVTSRTQVAVVADDSNHYRGILSLERISKEIIT